MAAACKLNLESVIFASAASAASLTAEGGSKKFEIEGSTKFGWKTTDALPSYGMYLKTNYDDATFDVNSMSYNGTNGAKLTVNYNGGIKDNYVVVQAFKQHTDADLTSGTTSYAAAAPIIADNGSIDIDISNWNLTDFSNYTFKVWMEDPAQKSLAKATTPVTFDGTGTNLTKTTSTPTIKNQRVFALKDDLKCSWGDMTQLSATEYKNVVEGKNQNGTTSDPGTIYGTNPTNQKIYFGEKDGTPLEFWIAGTDDDGNLVLYQANGYETATDERKEFNKNYSTNHTAIAAGNIGKHVDNASDLFGSFESMDDTNHSGPCKYCGAPLSVQHAWECKPLDGTDTHQEKCSICGHTKTAESHTWGNYTDAGNGQHQRTCTACSAKDTAQAHNWGNYTDAGEGKHQRTCTACGAEEAAQAHSWTVKYKDQTYHTSTCTACGVTEDEEHTWDDGTEVNGVTTYTCSKCSATKTERGEVTPPENPTPPADDDKKSWGTPQTVNGVTMYVAEDGTTSVEIAGTGTTWLRTNLGETSTWYGFDNKNGVFANGSKASVRWLNAKDDPERFNELWNKIDESKRQRIDMNKALLFDLEVTAPNGNQYTDLGQKVDMYVQIGDDWNKDELKGLYINLNGTNEDVNVSFANVPSPKGEVACGVMKISHFSPYLIYDELTNEERAALNNSSSSTKSGAIKTGDQLSVLILLVSLTGLVLSFGALAMLRSKRKSKRLS